MAIYLGNDDEKEEKTIKRMKQLFVVGGNFDQPSEFTKKVNRNIQILNESDKNCKIEDIKFQIFNDSRFSNYGPTYLAFIIAEVDVDLTPKVEQDGITRRKRKKKRR